MGTIASARTIPPIMLLTAELPDAMSKGSPMDPITVTTLSGTMTPMPRFPRSARVAPVTNDTAPLVQTVRKKATPRFPPRVPRFRLFQRQ